MGRIGLWVTIPVAGATWVGTTISQRYPVYDDWVIIDRATSGSWLREMFIGFNGHLWSLAYWAYHLQVNVLGLESNWFLPLLLVASLVALQLGVAAVLSRLGLPTVVALLAATVVTYFGPGSETMVFQLSLGGNFALALTFAAAYVALGKRHDRRTAIVVAAIAVAALFCDSALAVAGFLFLIVMVTYLWPFRLALVALVPPAVAHAAWYALDHSEVLIRGTCQNCRSVTFGASFGGRVDFGWAIFVRSAGGLVGGSVTAGEIFLGVAVAVACIGLAMRRLSRPVVASLVGGTLAAVAAVALISYTRAGFWRSIHVAIANLDGPGNRYLQPAAVFLMIAFIPAMAAAIRPSRRMVSWVVTAIASAGLIVVFAVNLSSLRPTRVLYEGLSYSVKSDVRQAVAVITAGCAPGEHLARKARPINASFQITVGLLERLIDRGALTAKFGRPAQPALRTRICRPT
ncbi:MAG: hypothetical protein E6G14_17895 [Actinobacteria bacterium]|nr:MAG: hypothetical protein E6G14_17895 [Actinomycetota bacterium]